MTNKVDRLIESIRHFKEEAMAAPTNSVSGGGIAGTEFTGDHPPVIKKKKTGRGSRKLWMQFFKRKI